jgi:hypothetical protein
MSAMLETWKKWVKHTSDAVMHWLQQEKRSFSDIAQFIRQHPNTSVTERTWLGLTYRFYSLHLDDVSLAMETRKIKENEEHILFMTISRPDSSPIVYRSYDEKSDLNNMVALPPLTKETAPVS